MAICDQVNSLISYHSNMWLNTFVDLIMSKGDYQPLLFTLWIMRNSWLNTSIDTPIQLIHCLKNIRFRNISKTALIFYGKSLIKVCRWSSTKSRNSWYQASIDHTECFSNSVILKILYQPFLKIFLIKKSSE